MHTISSTGHETLDAVLTIHRENQLISLRYEELHLAEKLTELKRNFLAKLAKIDLVEKHRERLLKQPETVGLVFRKKQPGSKEVFSIIEIESCQTLVVIFYS